MKKSQLFKLMFLSLILSFLNFQGSLAGCLKGLKKLLKIKSNLSIQSERYGEIVLGFKMDLIGKGSYGDVYRAYWKNQNRYVALKILHLTGRDGQILNRNYRLAYREVSVLKHFADLNENEREHIIYMYGYEQKIGNDNLPKMFIVMELERVSLQSYFYKNVEENSNYKANLNERENFLKKIIRGAATALEQFHKYAIHLDIKPDNFLISRTQNNEDYVINCKLIDFNTSVITPYKRKTIQTYGSPFFMAPEIRTTYIHQVNKIIRNNINKKRKVTRKVDIWAFGLMIYDLLYLKTDYFHQLIEENANIYNILDAEFVDYRLNAELNTDLDRVIKGCIQLRLNKRPSIIAIKLFLYGECNGFEYERNQLREDTNWCPK